MKRLLLFSFLLSGFAFNQTSSYYIKPVDTDAGYDSGEDSSYIVVNDVAPVNRLIFFIGGSGSSPDAYNSFIDHMGEEGFHVISLSYLNDVTAASLKDDTDPNAFSNYRQEICFGTPLSDAIAIDTLNSIFTRGTKLINYLEVNFPGDNWGQYLTASNEIDWSKVAIAGHSQGAGHAAYIAKYNAVERVAMFSGPNDYSDYFSSAADWLINVGVTPLYRYFSYLSLLDEVVDYEKQYEIINAFGVLTQGDSVHVDSNSPPYLNTHALYTTQPKGFALLFHNTTTKNSALNHAVWDYIFNTEHLNLVESELDELEFMPNPAKDILYLSDDFVNKNYCIYSFGGKLMQTGFISSEDPKIDVSRLCSGAFIIQIGTLTAKLIIE